MSPPPWPNSAASQYRLEPPHALRLHERLGRHAWQPWRATHTPMLSSYRVLDLSDERGQLCGHVFASLGAEVIAIEPPGGTRTRGLAPFADDIESADTSLWHWSYNRGKKSVELDLATDDPTYALQIAEVLAAEPRLENIYAPEPYRRDCRGRSPTAYELEWKSIGRTCCYFANRKRAPVRGAEHRSPLAAARATAATRCSSRPDGARPAAHRRESGA